jgi:hypothetical protein
MRNSNPLAGLCSVVVFAVFLTLLPGPAVRGQAPPVPAIVGEWGEVLDWTLGDNWGVEGIHAAMTREGEILLTGRQMCHGLQENTVLWHPKKGTITLIPAGEPTLFCGGHAHLADGSILFAGGGGGGCSNHADVRIFHNGLSGMWDVAPPMHFVRFYPNVTTLGDGRLLVTAGEGVWQHEIYNPASNSWTRSEKIKPLQSYSFMFLLPDGGVFFAGNYTSAFTPAVLYPDEDEWVELNLGAYPQIGCCGSAVMYAPGRILKGGGSAAPEATWRIDMNDPQPAWNPGPEFHHDREHGDLVLLPTGHILAVGGVGFPSPSMAVEWLDPNGQLPDWHELAEMAVIRGYHSTAILLPDARVLVAGPDGTFNGEIFSPPYLFWGPRPVIGSAPSVVAYGAEFSVHLPANGEYAREDIGEVVLMGLGAVTHSFDQNQRRVSLEPSSTPPIGEYVIPLLAPENPNNAPPGYYMLFLVTNSGIPSEAAFIQIVHP